MNIFDTMSDKTKMIGAGAAVLTLATIISYHIDKKKAIEEEDDFPEEDVYDPIIDEEDEA